MKTRVAFHFDKIAKDYDKYTKKRDFHYKSLKTLLKSLIQEDKKVLDVGCGTGDLLVAMMPRNGYGLDISVQMIKIAKGKYGKNRNLTFSTSWPKEKFDYVFMSDVIEHLEDRVGTFKKISKLMGPRSLFVNTMMNPVWIPIEKIYNFFGWKMPEGPYQRIGYNKLKKEIERAGMKVTKHHYKLLMPIKIPLLTYFANRYLEKYFGRFAFIEYLVARKI